MITLTIKYYVICDLVTVAAIKSASSFRKKSFIYVSSQNISFNNPSWLVRLS